MEGKRRAMLVRSFEIECTHRSASLDPAWQLAYRFYRAGDKPEGATHEDLWTLAEDEVVDYVILEHEFEGLSCANDGRYWIYDCKMLRTREAFQRHREARLRTRGGTDHAEREIERSPSALLER
jgi:hypothetical protein